MRDRAGNNFVTNVAVQPQCPRRPLWLLCHGAHANLAVPKPSRCSRRNRPVWEARTASTTSDPRLLPIAPMEIRSHGIVPGVIQVPHGGQPIIQMRDAQPSGGYPKFGSVIEADLWRLGQAPIGGKVRFIECSYLEAVEALETNRAYLREVSRLLELHREGVKA